MKSKPVKRAFQQFHIAIEQISRGEEVQIPSIYVLLEHKKLMLERIRLLIRRKMVDISQEMIGAYQDIFHQYEILINVYLKYLSTKNSDCVKLVKKLSEDAILKERSLLVQLCNILQP
jgi:hypothetical protein